MSAALVGANAGIMMPSFSRWHASYLSWFHRPAVGPHSSVGFVPREAVIPRSGRRGSMYVVM